MTVRKRKQVGPTSSGVRTITDTAFGYVQSFPYNFVEGKLTHDEVPTGWVLRNKLLRDMKGNKTLPPGWRQHLRRQDYGGNFSSIGYEYRTLNSPPLSGSSRYVLNGRVYSRTATADFQKLFDRVNWWGDGVTEPFHANDEAMFMLGGKAISLCAPTNPSANVFTMLGELKRDGLPTITGLQALRGQKPSDVAGEYLNFEFGVKPLLKDLRKLRDSLQRADALMKQYVRDSGRLVRRSYRFDPDHRSDLAVEGSASTPFPAHTWIYRNKVPRRKRTVSETQTWFSGAFTYYVNNDLWKGYAGEIQKINHLLGVLPTPSALYDLTPWTWFADWFVNLGDVVNNVSMFLTDGLVMPYGYVMRRETVSRIYDHYGCVTFLNEHAHGTQEFRYVAKLRRRASPFGFGLSEESFTARQLAILAALGISQGGSRTAM